MKKLIISALIAVSTFSEKIKIDLYFESQCPYCRETITGSFAEAFEHDDLLDMAEITMYPYGNAHEYASGNSWTFSCQHGVAECEYNTIEACAQHFITDPYQEFDFILCVEENDQKKNYDEVLDLCGRERRGGEGPRGAECGGAPPS